MEDHSFYVVANQMMQECFDEADREADLIFGNNEDLPDDEAELIFSEPFRNLSQPAKLQALTELRAKKGAQAN